MDAEWKKKKESVVKIECLQQGDPFRFPNTVGVHIKSDEYDSKTKAHSCVALVDGTLTKVTSGREVIPLKQVNKVEFVDDV